MIELSIISGQVSHTVSHIFRVGSTSDILIVIQGNADTQSAKKLSEDELRQTIDFCTSAFAPSSAEEKSRVEELVLQASGNGTAAQQTMSEDPEAKRIEARKLMRTSDTLHIDAFVSDDINGLHLKLKRGQLGLERS